MEAVITSEKDRATESTWVPRIELNWIEFVSNVERVVYLWMEAVITSEKDRATESTWVPRIELNLIEFVSNVERVVYLWMEAVITSEKGPVTESTWVPRIELNLYPMLKEWFIYGWKQSLLVKSVVHLKVLGFLELNWIELPFN